MLQNTAVHGVDGCKCTLCHREYALAPMIPTDVTYCRACVVCAQQETDTSHHKQKQIQRLQQLEKYLARSVPLDSPGLQCVENTRPLT